MSFSSSSLCQAASHDFPFVITSRVLLGMQFVHLIAFKLVKGRITLPFRWIAIQRITVNKTYCAIHRTEIYQWIALSTLRTRGARSLCHLVKVLSFSPNSLHGSLYLPLLEKSHTKRQSSTALGKDVLPVENKQFPLFYLQTTYF